VRKSFIGVIGLTLVFAITGVVAQMNETVPVQSFQTTTSKPASRVVKHAVVAAGNVTAVNQQSAVLQAELTQLNQNNLLYQQKTDARLEDIAEKNQAMQTQLQQLTQALTLLNQEVMALKQMNAAMQQATQSNSVVAHVQWLDALKNKLGTLGMIVLVLVVLGLLTWMAWPRRRPKKQSPQPVAEKTTLVPDDLDDTKVEYDYMGSNESIPAKLNLARAYVAMEDYSAARKVLNEVAQAGSREQQQQAEELRKVLPAEV
jgi:FimV-like protein